MVAELTRSALPGVEVTAMRRWHLRQVLEIEHVVCPRPWSRAVFVSELTQPLSRRYLIARAPLPEALLPRWLVVGYVGLMVTLDEAHLTTIAVHPHHHRRKIASRLLLAILHEARAMGATAATLEVRLANRGAQRLYGQFGFAPVGIRPGYYAETGEDALIMWTHELQSEAFAERLAGQAARLDAPGGSSGAPDLEVPWCQGRIGLEGEGRAVGPAGGRGSKGEGRAVGPAGGRGSKGEGRAVGPAGAGGRAFKGEGWPEGRGSESQGE